jgi:4-amino-4-deoxy-L-arabinose transferase-like glycosyltransferase
MKKDKIIDVILICALIILNIIIKSLFLDDYNIDLDEPFTIYHAQGSLWDIANLLRWENNPPLFFVILHFWIKIFGIGVSAVRFLPMLFGSLAVYFIYKIGKKYINVVAAIGASLLYTFSNENIGQAHDTRVYTLFVLLTAASMYFYFSLIEADNKRKYLIALTATNVLLMYSHFLAIFVLLLQALYTLTIPFIRKKNKKEFIVSSSIIFLCYLPYLYIFLIRLFYSVHDGLWTPKSNLTNLYTFLLAFCNYWYRIENIFLGILLVFALAFILTRNKLKLTLVQSMIMGWFFIPYLLMFLISYKLPILTPLYMIFLIPGFYLAIMLAISKVTDALADKLGRYLKLLGIALTALCVCFMFITVNPKYSYGFQGAKAVSIIRENKTDSTGVLIVPGWISLTFSYHYDINMFKDFGKYQNRLNNDNIFIAGTAKDMDTSRMKGFAEILLLDGWDGMRLTDPNRTILQELNKRFGKVDTIALINFYKIYRFRKKDTEI